MHQQATPEGALVSSFQKSLFIFSSFSYSLQEQGHYDSGNTWLHSIMTTKEKVKKNWFNPRHHPTTPHTRMSRPLSLTEPC